MASPCYTLMCDSSTDISNEDHLLIYFKYMDPTTFITSINYFCCVRVVCAGADSMTQVSPSSSLENSAKNNLRKRRTPAGVAVTTRYCWLGQTTPRWFLHRRCQCFHRQDQWRLPSIARTSATLDPHTQCCTSLQPCHGRQVMLLFGKLLRNNQYANTSQKKLTYRLI